ncbi:MAG: amino acid adenylation domain-containing protein [Cytophagales bacterium]|nr:amino acid adenylation domain-containing protein [Cytophagales bacterium]
MSIDEYITHLRSNNIIVSVKENQLEVEASEGDLTESIIDELKAKKPSIIQFFNSLGAVYQPIKPVVKREYYPLSSAQHRMYFLYQFEPHALTYNMPQIVRLDGELDKDRLEYAFRKLVDRHESLRTSFKLIDDEPVQEIKEQVDFQLEYYQSNEEEVQQVINKFIRPFDLAKAPLIRVGLITEIKSSEQGSTAHILMVDMNHIVIDGVSQGILINDFMSLYYNEELPPLHLQYKDYAVWQQRAEQQAALSQQKAYWLEEYADLPPVLELPYDHKRPMVKNSQGSNLSFSVPVEQTAQLKSIAESEGATLFMVMLSVYSILLSKLSNREDLVIGTPTAGRQHADVENMIGMFVNTLAMRSYPKGTLSFREFLSAIQSMTLASFDHQGYQYEELIDALKIERDTSRNPLFDVMFAYQNFEESSLQMPGLKLSSLNNGQSVSKFDLTLTVSESVEQLFLEFEYSNELFERETIERFVTYFNNVVTTIISNPEIRLSHIEVISASEKYQLLHKFNDTKADYPREETLASLFDRQVRATPDNLALIHNQIEISYRELDEKSNRLAYLLKSKGVGEGSVIGLMLDRSVGMIIGLLGILKAGGTYLPLDTSQPEKRNTDILQQSDATLLLTSTHDRFAYESYIDVVTLDEPNIYPGDERDLKISSFSSSGIAYIIYTSGSTGKPKGVMVSHRSVINLVHSQKETFGISDDERILQFSNIVFDASMEQIWLALLSGSTLVLASREVILNHENFNDYISDFNITHLDVTPSFLENLDSDFHPTLRRIVIGGERCKVQIADELWKKYKVYNAYGPSEATVTSIEYLIDRPLNERIPIGRPINNTVVYVLDVHQQLLPKGVGGELYIGGDCLAAGYLNDKELTREKFVANPFRPGERMYRTGDLARWLPDGNIEFLGRIDDQVKIRGFRIELGETEHHLTSHDQVNKAIVLAKEKDGENFLVAYYVAEEALETMGLRDYLSGNLPDYMVPAYYVHLDKVPLNANGKVDKKALPDAEIGSTYSYVAPSNATEEQLVGIWGEVLKLDKEVIGVTRSFFELGGHSLKATLLVNKIFKEMNVEVPLREVFRESTVHKMAEYIENEMWIRKNDKQNSPKGEEFVID